MLVDIKETILQPNLPFESDFVISKLIFEFLDKQPEGKKFFSQDIGDFIAYTTGGRRKPQGGTITRCIRLYRARVRSVVVTNSAKSEYMIEPKGDV